jgi:hypothetical protein
MMGNLLLGIWRDVLGSRRMSSLSDTLADSPYGAFAQLGLARVPNTPSWSRGSSGEGVGWTHGRGRLEHDVCIFWCTARYGFSSPKSG